MPYKNKEDKIQYNREYRRIRNTKAETDFLRTIQHTMDKGRTREGYWDLSSKQLEKLNEQINERLTKLSSVYPKENIGSIKLKN
mgnify:CR=1 FL=1